MAGGGLGAHRLFKASGAHMATEATGLEPVDEGCPKPATAPAFRGIGSESGHFESTGLSPLAPTFPKSPPVLETCWRQHQK
jgi:hypothetical protein